MQRLFSLLVLVGCLFFGVAQAEVWPREARVPGGIALVAVPQTSSAPPQVWFEEQRVFVAQKSGKWYAWVGIPLDYKLGTTQAYWRTKEGDYPLEFSVQAKQYPEQRLEVEPKHVSLSKENLARVQRETPELRAAMDSFRPVVIPLKELIKPVEGRHSSQFGFRRVFNGQARNPHSGLDIAAPTGTPVVAALPGKLVAKNDYFFNGKTVVIDHGQGFTSMYCHLNEFADLTLGATLEAGQLIGKVGATGRVTGPHLHWTLSLNGARVDPELFLAD